MSQQKSAARFLEGIPGRTVLPVDSAARKNFPIHTVVNGYFPAAIAAIAKLCKLGNDKHNPGQPLHWARWKSNDQAECIARHGMDLGADYGEGRARDENGVPQVVYRAWRALAECQEWLEEHEGAPLPFACKLNPELAIGQDFERDADGDYADLG